MSLGAPSAFFNGLNSSSRKTSHTAKSLQIFHITAITITAAGAAAIIIIFFKVKYKLGSKDSKVQKLTLK